MPQNRPATASCLGVSTAEWIRLRALNEYEDEARRNGFCLVAGVDEAGRGPLAGPVVAAACLLPENFYLPGINDSKQLNAKQREALFASLTGNPAIHYGIGIIDAATIDSINIYQATILAMLQAIAALAVQPDMLLVDGMPLPHPTIPCLKIIKGDEKSQSIAAASVIAKETRDAMMRDFHALWPQYGFDSHKGYGTEKHLRALAEHGPCPIHRRSYAPVAAAGGA